MTVNQVAANHTVVGVDQLFTVTAQIQTDATDTVGSSTAQWMVAGEQLSESVIPPLESGQSRQAIWKHSFSTPGVYDVSCRVQSKDELSNDK